MHMKERDEQKSSSDGMQPDPQNEQEVYFAKENYSPNISRILRLIPFLLHFVGKACKN